MFNKHYKKGKTYLKNARKQESSGHLKDALDIYQKAIGEFKIQGSSLFHDVKGRLAEAYLECSNVYKRLGEMDNADTYYKEAKKYGLDSREALIEPETLKNPLQTENSSTGPSVSSNSLIETKFFTQDQMVAFEPHSKIDDIHSTYDLAYYLQSNSWIHEQDSQLTKLALEIIELFAKRNFKTKEMIHEVVALASIPDKQIYKNLLELSIDEIKKSTLQHSEHFFCLAQVIQNMHNVIIGKIYTGDLVNILRILHEHLEKQHRQDNEDQLSELLQTICLLLDAMVRVGVKGISREKLHTPLYQQLKELKDYPVLSYHARYACQALLYVTNDEKFWQGVMRRFSKVTTGTLNLVSAVKNLDPKKLLETFQDFSDAFEGVREIISGFQDIFEEVQELEEGIEDICQELRETSLWYLALRDVDTYIQENQLVKLEQFVRQTPYKKNKWFLIGLCQRLGFIACIQLDSKVQQGAVEFLGDIYQNENHWKQHFEVKEWVLAILRQLANQGDEYLKNYAKVMISKVVPGENALNSSIDMPHIVNLAKPSEVNSELLNEARLKLSQNLMSNATELLAQLGKIKKDLYRLEQDEEIRNSLDLYVSPKGKWSLNSPESFELKAEVDIFLASEKKVLLLLGEAGAGKSTFNHHLSRRLWEDYSLKDELDNKPIPIFISLTTIKNPNEKMIQKYLREIGFSKKIIENLKQKYKFIFILDGYDEIKDRQSNLYDKNKLDEWDAKVIISCRPEYLGVKYHQKFYPNHNPRHFQEICLAPFSKKEIREYIRKYVEKQKDVVQKIWGVQNYETVLKSIPNSDQLFGNPFILKIAMQVMPDLYQQENENTVKNITRLALYKKFVEKWFERSQDRLNHIKLDVEEQKSFKELEQDDFSQHCMRFNKDLAVSMFMANEIEVEYSGVDNIKLQTNWRAKFFGHKDPMVCLLRYNSPLSRNGNKYRFIHKSLSEYFVARVICETICEESRSKLFEENLILREPGIVRFLTEHVQQNICFEDIQQAKKLKDNLLNFIEKSKEDINFKIAAANAITILNKAGIVFNGKNLNGIHIAGADLSYGVFDRAKFKGADLSNVNFKGAWLRYADFSDANMSGVQFGELPFLDHQNSCICCCYSPDGRFFAIASGHKVYPYNIETLENICTFEGHTNIVVSISFSPDSTQLASCSWDKTVRLWSIKNLYLNSHILEGHTEWVNSVTFSPDGTQLASGSSDKTVRLWSLENLDVKPRILEGHSNSVISVTFSPDGTQLASGSWDDTVRLWSLENLDPNPRIIGHTGGVNSVTFSPDGTQLASGSSDYTVRLWSLENLDLNPCILKGHTNYVQSVTFSSDGTQIASGSLDKTVRLWSLENLDLNPRILEGHTNNVLSVTFSPDDTQLASGSDDNTVRLWSLENLDPNPRMIGHTSNVNSVIFSPNGTQIASGSLDKTVRLWSLENLDLNPRIIEGHSDNIRSVTFSPDGTQLASGSDDKTVRIWSLESLDLNPRILEGHTDWVKSVTFSPDGTQLASGSDDNTVRLWALENLDPNSRILEGHTDLVNSVTFSPDGTQLASGSDDNTVRLWSLENLDLNPRILEGHTDWVNSVTFSPDGTQLASSSLDKTVRLWSLKNLDLIPRILGGHSGNVRSVTFSPDGLQLASGSSDNTVRLWSTTSGNCLVIIRLPEIIYSLDWKNTKAGDLLLTGSSNGGIRLWHVKRIDNQMPQVALHWTSRQNILWISKAFIQDVKGLSPMNLRLLKQRCAN